MKRQSDKQTFSMNFGAKKWAALYVRLSRDDDSEGDSNSIAHQIEILKKYAKDHNIIQYKIYKDDGYSGAGIIKNNLSLSFHILYNSPFFLITYNPVTIKYIHSFHNSRIILPIDFYNNPHYNT